MNAQVFQESPMGRRVEEDPNLVGVSTKGESLEYLLI